MSDFNYTRKQLEGFFKWQMKTCLKHFFDDVEAEERAKHFAAIRPIADGFITFQTKYRGKRFFWIKDGNANEIEPMECFLKVEDQEYSRAKKLIRERLFKNREPIAHDD